ncbi:hypothetical protein [Anaeromicropila populeti]|uniref:Uncharacterized protein n=1 Tax=Anaeromicropila populeti TaxID=37658 RepID=A0A1I6I5X4_9FIRM|nr:hypothetical protein [Anaeromicropila populeti]SFR62147.1 hypothetical protein SAMN05661086_00453 [Anaeromicropila populeti]
MSRKKGFITFLALLCLLSFSIALFKSFNREQTQPKETGIIYGENETSNKVEISELRAVSDNKSAHVVCDTIEVLLTDAQLVDLSTIIVKGKVTECLGEYTYTLTEDGRAPFSTVRKLYNFELTDTLKGIPEEDMKLATGPAAREDAFEIGKEYIWCLYPMEGDYEGAYEPVSYACGLLSIDSEQLSPKRLTLTELKELIQKIENNEGEFVEELNDDMYVKMKSVLKHMEQ